MTFNSMNTERQLSFTPGMATPRRTGWRSRDNLLMRCDGIQMTFNSMNTERQLSFTPGFSPVPSRAFRTKTVSTVFMQTVKTVS
jgi:hypothetical protein